ncbi:MAG: hypothetical protein ACTSUE_05100 [Promethearchaeota archaeon]
MANNYKTTLYVGWFLRTFILKPVLLFLIVYNAVMIGISWNRDNDINDPHFMYNTFHLPTIAFTMWYMSISIQDISVTGFFAFALSIMSVVMLWLSIEEYHRDTYGKGQAELISMDIVQNGTYRYIGPNRDNSTFFMNKTVLISDTSEWFNNNNKHKTFEVKIVFTWIMFILLLVTSTVWLVTLILKTCARYCNGAACCLQRYRGDYAHKLSENESDPVSVDPNEDGDLHDEVVIQSNKDDELEYDSDGGDAHAEILTSGCSSPFYSLRKALSIGTRLRTAVVGSRIVLCVIVIGIAVIDYSTTMIAYMEGITPWQDVDSPHIVLYMACTMVMFTSYLTMNREIVLIRSKRVNGKLKFLYGHVVYNIFVLVLLTGGVVIAFLQNAMNREMVEMQDNFTLLPGRTNVPKDERFRNHQYYRDTMKVYATDGIPFTTTTIQYKMRTCKSTYWYEGSRLNNVDHNISGVFATLSVRAHRITTTLIAFGIVIWLLYLIDLSVLLYTSFRHKAYVQELENYKNKHKVDENSNTPLLSGTPEYQKMREIRDKWDERLQSVDRYIGVMELAEQSKLNL